MRALAGPAFLLVMAGGFMIFRFTGNEAAPSRDFTELEFAGADVEHTGTCYSLSTVLIANRVFSDAARTWVSPRKGVWTLSLDNVEQSYNGPVHVFQKYTFEQRGDQVELTDITASQDLTTDLESNIIDLLREPRSRHSTPVDRCTQPGATGYLYQPRR